MKLIEDKETDLVKKLRCETKEGKATFRSHDREWWQLIPKLFERNVFNDAHHL
ncbi:hypothetical protein GCM10011513_23960 [Franconibacter daqui]|nr:hypothetical protein GCM10011513_23960 [Franconibacter daqui]